MRRQKDRKMGCSVPSLVGVCQDPTQHTARIYLCRKHTSINLTPREFMVKHHVAV